MSEMRRGPAPEEIGETPEERGWFASRPREFVDEQAKIEREAVDLERRIHLQAWEELEIQLEVEAQTDAIEKTLRKAGRHIKRLSRNALLAGALLGSTASFSPPQERSAILEAERTSKAWEGLPPLEEMLAHLQRAYGREAIAEMVPASTAERRDWAREPIAEVDSSFERFGIDRPTLTRYLHEGYPRFMTARGTVARITYLDERHPMPESYGLRSDAHAAATCTNAPNREAAVITYYRDAFANEDDVFDQSVPERRILALRDTLPHELAHAVDWQDMADIDPARRVEILYRLTRLVEDEQYMLRFGYAEDIENPDPQERLRLRATEYFADLVAEVLAHPSSAEDAEEAIFNTALNLAVNRAHMPAALERLPPQDARRVAWEETMRERTIEAVRLVHDYVHAIDPEFDFELAERAREQVLIELEAAEQERRIRSLLEGLPPRVRAAMESTRHIPVEGLVDQMMTRYLDASDDQGSDTPSHEILIFLNSDTGRELAPDQRRSLQAVADRASAAEGRFMDWVQGHFRAAHQGLTGGEHAILAPLANIMADLHAYDMRKGNVRVRAHDLERIARYQDQLRTALAAAQPTDTDPFAEAAYPEGVVTTLERVASLYRRDQPPPRELVQALERAEREAHEALIAAMPD